MAVNDLLILSNVGNNSEGGLLLLSLIAFTVIVAIVFASMSWKIDKIENLGREIGSKQDCESIFCGACSKLLEVDLSKTQSSCPFCRSVIQIKRREQPGQPPILIFGPPAPPPDYPNEIKAALVTLEVGSLDDEKVLEAVFQKKVQAFSPDSVRHLGPEIAQIAATKLREVRDAMEQIRKYKTPLAPVEVAPTIPNEAPRQTMHTASIEPPIAAPSAPLQSTFSASTTVHETQSSDKPILPAFLLCLFFGVLGFHRFFVGKTGSGVAQMLTLGGLGVWAFIDFIMIISGGFTDADGRKLTRWS